MTTNEGYLTHTLPVKTSELIWSKAIAAIFWTLISFIVIMIAVLILTFNAEGFKEFFPMFVEMCSDFIHSYGASVHIPLIIAELILGALLNGIFFIFSVYASIAIGQLFDKHKIAWAIVSYFLIDVGIQLISTITSIPVVENISIESPIELVTLASNQFIPISLAFTGVVSLILYSITWYIFKIKLNLE